jgi:hypothetical protein
MGARWARRILRKDDGAAGRILFPPMLFPGNALASGPLACFYANKRMAKANGGNPKAGIDITCTYGIYIRNP